jgi:hypothetical protein
MNECTQAVELCAQAIDAGKASRASYEDYAKVYQRMAAAHYKGGDTEAAIKAYGKAQMEKFDKVCYVF